MARRIESHFLPGPAGRLEALLEEPEDAPPRLAVVLCHPHPRYAGTMHNKVVYRLARGLRSGGAVVLRFNFRGVGASAGEYGDLAGEVEDARAALQWLRARYPDIPFALAGFSFGARVITQLGCALPEARFLLATGLSNRLGSVEYLQTCRIPKFFIASTHDEYAPREEFQALYETFAGPKQLTWIEAENHFFAGALEQVEAAAKQAAGSPEDT